MALLASAAAVLAASSSLASTPCRDVPDFETLACRVAELRESTAGMGKMLSARLERAAGRLEQGERACSEGDTSLTQRQLSHARLELRRAQHVLDGLARRGEIHPLDAEAISGRLRSTQALRRATRARIDRSGCPMLVEILRPSPGEVIDGDQISILLEFSEAADPRSVRVVRETPAPGRVFASLASSPQLFLLTACESSGRHSFRIRVSNAAHTATQEQSVAVECGVRDFALGSEVELLVDTDHRADGLRLTPVRPLRNGATYAVVATTNLRAKGGQRIRASEAFRRAAGLPIDAPQSGPEAFYATDPGDPRNPFPSERLVQADGTIRIPDGFTARAVPEIPRLRGVRDFLRRLDAGSEEHRGFSPSTSVVLHFSDPVNLERTKPANLFLVEIAHPGSTATQLSSLLGALHEQRGLRAEDIAVASLFPVENLRGVMATIHEQIAARAAVSPPAPDFADPDPSDARRFGIFRPGDAEFAGFFGGAPPTRVGAVARGSFPSPDYRESGRFPDRFVDGRDVPPHVALDFLLAVPVGSAPPGGFPTVVLQHGFGGDNTFVTQNAADFTEAGLAVIGIPAPEHGPRGASFLDFFVFEDFNAFGNNFRQSSVDLLQLVQLIQAGIDLDGDGISELRGADPGYLGVSLGGVIGGVFAAVEPAIRTAVLNVPGGRLAQFAGGTSSLAVPFLASFAAEAGIPVRTCSGEPTASACSADRDCDRGVTCRFNADFELLLESGLPNFQTQLDPGDGISYARGMRIEPEPGDPKAVLIQEGIGDVIVTNPLTEALARAIALPVGRPDVSPHGAAGLWRFPPPTGHGIFGLPDVRAQAIRFLLSGGTVLSAP